MSFEDSVLLHLMRAVDSVGLEAVVIGNAAAALHGVPVTTQDIDLFIRETPRNLEKITARRRSIAAASVTTARSSSRSGPDPVGRPLTL